MSVSKKRLMSVFAAVMMLVVFVMGTGVRVFAAADVSYIPSWEEYVASGKPSDTWNDKANAIDDCIEAAIKLYQAGDKEAAYTPALNIYNFYYETSGFNVL